MERDQSFVEVKIGKNLRFFDKKKKTTLSTLYSYTTSCLKDFFHHHFLH